MKGKKKCLHCGKMFKLKGLGIHEKHCIKARSDRGETIADTTSNQAQPPSIDWEKKAHFDKGYSEGRRDLAQETLQRSLQVKSDLIGACSHMTEACAHMIADIVRQEREMPKSTYQTPAPLLGERSKY
jgi:hypothetical protein